MLMLESYLWGRCQISNPSKRLESVEPTNNYDFIVVGAGTAGSIVAGRLSEDGKYNVSLTYTNIYYKLMIFILIDCFTSKVASKQVYCPIITISDVT